MLVIDIDGLTFHGQANTAPDRGYFLIEPEGFTGWDDGVDVRREEVMRSNAHGAFDSLGYFSPRVASVSGVYIGHSQEDTEQQGMRLTGLLAGTPAGRMIVTRKSGSQFADGRLASKTKFMVRSATPSIADFQIQMWFSNPRKFGPFQQFASAADGRWTAYHRGNFGASGVIDITGSCPGYTVGGPDSTEYKVSAAVTSSQPHQIDLGTGLLTIGGQVAFGKAIRADTWVVAPGQQVPHRITPDGTGTTVNAVMTLRDTYI